MLPRPVTGLSGPADYFRRFACNFSLLDQQLVFRDAPVFFAGFPCISGVFRQRLVFRETNDLAPQTGDEVSTDGAELLLRQLPRQTIKRRIEPRRFDHIRRAPRRPLLGAPFDEVAGVALVPGGLRGLTSRLLALRTTADTLSVTYVRIRDEPTVANPATALTPRSERGHPLPLPDSASRCQQPRWRFFESRPRPILESASAWN